MNTCMLLGAFCIPRHGNGANFSVVVCVFAGGCRSRPRQHYFQIRYLRGVPGKLGPASAVLHRVDEKQSASQVLQSALFDVATSLVLQSSLEIVERNAALRTLPSITSDPTHTLKESPISPTFGRHAVIEKAVSYLYALLAVSSYFPSPQREPHVNGGSEKIYCTKARFCRRSLQDSENTFGFGSRGERERRCGPLVSRCAFRSIPTTWRLRSWRRRTNIRINFKNFVDSEKLLPALTTIQLEHPWSSLDTDWMNSKSELS